VLSALWSGRDMADPSTIYAHYAPPVYTLALRLLGTPAHAEAVLLDVLTAWIPHLAGAAPLPRAFPLLVVPTYTTAVRYRTPCTTGTCPSTMPPPTMPEAVPADIARIHQQLAVLTPEQRDCLILWTSTIPMPLIATCLGCPSTMVRAHLQASLQCLRRSAPPDVLIALAQSDMRLDPART
jgi:DNA-directed RNA polymerase specialized sigma24 family protein